MNTETPKALLEGINRSADKIGWRLRELGVGIVVIDGSIRLTAYEPGDLAGLPALAMEELIEGLQGGWQNADEHEANAWQPPARG